MSNLSDDLSPAQALAVLLGAAIYAGAQWVRHRLGHNRQPDQATAWAEGFRAGVLAASTGNPQPNPYRPSTEPLIDRQE